MLRSLELKDHMLKHPVSVDVDSDMGEAIRLIIDNKISGLCVVDSDNRLVGILSELDCLRAMLSASYNEGGIGMVREYMAHCPCDTFMQPNIPSIFSWTISYCSVMSLCFSHLSSLNFGLSIASLIYIACVYLYTLLFTSIVCFEVSGIYLPIISVSIQSLFIISGGVVAL